MPDHRFKVAMGNNIHTGPYDPPELAPQNSGYEWLIVRHWGDRGQYLEISDTTVLKPDGSRGRGNFEWLVPLVAPPSLQAHQSMLGLLVRKENRSATFLLVRRNVDNLAVSGRFYPVDGYAELSKTDDRWTLIASGRHAHDDSGNDIPHPAQDQDMSWHFDAAAAFWEKQEL